MSKTIHISQIEEGIKKVRKLGHLEETFDILGQSITLRTVLRKELEAANQVCQPLFDLSQKSEDTFSFSNWIQAMKIETLTYAIMELDSIDFHDVDYITTNDIDEQTGHPIKIQKHVFVRGIVAGWEDSVIDTVFKKFNELTERAQVKAVEGVEFEENDPQVRIEELEQELKTLRSQIQKEKDSKAQQGAVEDSSIDKEVLKERMFSEPEPVNEPEGHRTAPPSEENEGYMYEQKRGATSQPNNPHQESVGGDHTQQPLYYNEDGDPLTGDELAAAEAQDRLLQERAGTGRQPLNQVDAQVRGGHEGPQNTVNANKRQNQQDFVVDPAMEREAEVLTPRKPIERGNPRINEGPDPNVNPNFRPPNKRNK